ncbi:unnamed protein product [Acanthoscelides obtectus]|uniref:DNA replication complex GINS protein PSF3 n=1 Tax=Acanthoscelides obtectus TaxID=200917 RepID=A0A9P0LVG4_ACAOB|nr:unnamed protein product [Acanthoscelides obtectus]CAK1645007.1 DNA replication complex GINS protein PSF3 [Acanthoscelides obtectus]
MERAKVDRLLAWKRVVLYFSCLGKEAWLILCEHASFPLDYDGNSRRYLGNARAHALQVLTECPKNGQLNPSAAERDIKAGTSLELPLWLVIEMSAGRQPIVTPELPKVFRESYREILKADACAVDLHKYSLHFL